MIGHFEEKNENRCLVLDDVDESKKVWECIKEETETINGGEKIEYGKDFLKNRFKSNDNLPLNKPIQIRLLAIIIRLVFSEGGKCYPQLFLDDALYQLV